MIRKIRKKGVQQLLVLVNYIIRNDSTVERTVVEEC